MQAITALVAGPGMGPCATPARPIRGHDVQVCLSHRIQINTDPLIMSGFGSAPICRTGTNENCIYLGEIVVRVRAAAEIGDSQVVFDGAGHPAVGAVVVQGCKIDEFQRWWCSNLAQTPFFKLTIVCGRFENTG